jgi:hypothetical protein
MSEADVATTRALAIRKEVRMSRGFELSKNGGVNFIIDLVHAAML